MKISHFFFFFFHDFEKFWVAQMENVGHHQKDGSELDFRREKVPSKFLWQDDHHHAAISMNIHPYTISLLDVMKRNIWYTLFMEN